MMSAISAFLATPPQPMPPYPVILIKRAIELARILDGVAYEEFLQRQELMDATARCVQIISDVVERLSPAEQAPLSQINLHAFTGVGDHLIHNYDTVDYGRIWSLTQNEIPALRLALQHAHSPSA